MSKKNKTIREKELLAVQEREEVINNVLQFSRKRFKKFDEVILQLYLNKDLSSFFADQRIAKVHECFMKFSSKARGVERAILKNVFVHIHKNSVLMSREDYIHVVFNAVEFRAYWQNDVFIWKPSSNRGWAQVNELISYLFCQYKVPGFLYKAFAETTNMLFINWFIHIGTGRKVKELINVPISFTQKMGHYFLQEPDKFTVPEALRWAQVRGLNGDEKLAERIAYSWIGTKAYGDEDFWETFIRIVIDGGMFDYDRLTGIIDYVRDTKRENGNYSLKGRTLSSLMGQSEEWHRNAAFTRGNQYWNLSGLYGYKVERKMK